MLLRRSLVCREGGAVLYCGALVAYGTHISGKNLSDEKSHQR